MTPTTTSSRWFSRGDHIAYTLVVVLAALVATGVFVVVPLARWIGRDAIPVSYNGSLTAPALDRSHLRYTAGGASAEVSGGDGLSYLVAMVPDLLLGAVVLAICWILWRLGRDVAAGDPFTSANTWRVRSVAILVAVAAALVPLAGAVAESVVISRAGLTDVLRGQSWSVTFNLLPFALALVIALIAQVFAIGNRMREDLEGVI